jgi:hypothetical protein
MTDFGIRAFVVASLAGAVILTGCSHKVNIQTSQGNVSVDSGANGTTIKSGAGDVTVGKAAIDPAKVGMPVYPGATQSNDSVAINDTSKGQGASVVVLTTTDPFDKVYAFYKSQMPPGSEKMKVSSGDTDVAEFLTGDSSDQKVVMISGAKDKVTIQLTHSTKK